MTVNLDGESLPISAILFDKDGTLLDSLGPWAAVELSLARRLVSSRLGLSVLSPEVEKAAWELCLLLGITSRGVDRRGLLATGTTDAILSALELGLSGSFPETLPRTGKAPSVGFLAEVDAILADLIPNGPPPSPAMGGADSSLEALRSLGLPIGLATSDDEASTLADLARLGWTDHFDFISTGDTASAPKPDPWPVEAFSRAVGVRPSGIAVVGDTEADLAMARAAGAALFIRVDTGLEGLVPRLTEGLSFSTMGPYGREYPPLEICRIL